MSDIQEIIVSDRTKSGGTLRLATDPSRWAVVKDRGHRLGFVIRIFHERSPEPVRVVRTSPGVLWRDAYNTAREMLSDPSTLRLIQPPLPVAPVSEKDISGGTGVRTQRSRTTRRVRKAMPERVSPSAEAANRPMHRLRSVTLKRFKRIDSAAFDLKDINVLVGGNNSGKSSIIQGLHFGVALLQTIALSGQWKDRTSLNPNQLIYSPAEDVYALGSGGRLLTDEEQSMSLDFVLTSGDACGVEVRRGRNRNILVTIKNPDAAQQLSSLELPFSIFSPGLAGIAKRENYVSDGVLLRTLARGDANLILRNILYRLSHSPNPERWSNFLSDLTEVFPGLDISIDFITSTSEFIDVTVTSGGHSVPLELAGTGVLQALQILSYIHNFAPSIVVLDEPDSHLHPNNQRLLCGLLRRVAEERGTQVLLTTHSRHVVDALGAAAGFLWVRNGTVDVAGTDDELGILLDIGALDVKERAGQSSTSTVVLTEDELTRGLGLILRSSGFDLDHTAILPYFGVTGIAQLRPLVKVIQGVNSKAKIILHRDRDFLNDDEVEEWKKSVRALGVEPFVPEGRDIESMFLNPKYLAAANPPTSVEEFEDLVQRTLESNKSDLISAYVNGRIEVARRARGQPPNAGDLAVEANQNVSANAGRYAGKSMLRALRTAFRQQHGRNLKTDALSTMLRDEVLAITAGKVPKNRAQPAGGGRDP